MKKTTITVLIVGTILVLAGVGAYFFFRRKPKPQPQQQPQPQPNILQDAFDNLNFDFGKATIRESSNASLDKLAQTLIDAKNWKLNIAGHTDDKMGLRAVVRSSFAGRAKSGKRLFIAAINQHQPTAESRGRIGCHQIVTKVVQKCSQ